VSELNAFYCGGQLSYIYARILFLFTTTVVQMCFVNRPVYLSISRQSPCVVCPLPRLTATAVGLLWLIRQLGYFLPRSECQRRASSVRAYICPCESVVTTFSAPMDHLFMSLCLCLFFSCAPSLPVSLSPQLQRPESVLQNTCSACDQSPVKRLLCLIRMFKEGAAAAAATIADTFIISVK